MPVHKSQGGARPQAPRPDELPAGVPDAPRPKANRDGRGRFVSGPGTRAAAAKAAKAKAEAAKLARLLGFADIPDDHAFARYHRLAREWRDAHVSELASTVGGGQVGPGPASIVATAALQLAASRYFVDLGTEHGTPKLIMLGSKLANESRQNLLCAHELCAREAKARETIQAHGDVPWFLPASESPSETSEDEGDHG